MKEALYTELAQLIRRHHTWCTVVDTDSEAMFSQQINGELLFVRCRQLTLAALQSRGIYSKGHTWNIPMPRLDKSLSYLKQRNPSFKKRCKDGQLTMEDAEDIIAHASYNLIQLELEDKTLWCSEDSLQSCQRPLNPKA